jgi:cyclophilin family peptidyl-prolyl cis-trans isomerase
MNALLTLLIFCAPPAAAAKNPTVVITTSMGVIKAELDVAHAPTTVANFLQYVDDKYYDGTIFNRVIKDFMVQTGGYTADLHLRNTGPKRPIKNEGAAARKNVTGALAMAHDDDPDSATTHFFIDVRDNPDLDWKSDKEPGYCVFGKVIAGMDVVHKIEKAPTSTQKNVPDVPVTPVTVLSIRRE